MNWAATLSAFGKVWVSILATIACIAGLLRLISSNTPISTGRTLVAVAMLLLFVSAAVTIAQFRHEYGLLTTTVSATLKIDLEHGESVARYRLAAQSRGGQLRDVKVWIVTCPPFLIQS
jgi:hypothetical protein